MEGVEEQFWIYLRPSFAASPLHTHISNHHEGKAFADAGEKRHLA